MRNTTFQSLSVIWVAACLLCAASAVQGASDLPQLPSAASSEGQKLVLGQKLSLEGLGPAIVGEDGTLKRIANWGKLSEREKKVAFARIHERNQERLAALKEQNLSPEKKLAQQDHLTKYLKALEALNSASDGKDLQHELLKHAGLSTEGKEGPGVDYKKLQATLELLRNQQEAAAAKKSEL